ncbi:MAG: GNAT family N-acetyltransferase [Myxococcales bacterium]|nr:GNAT family N-acetyltransferase [Myxococcales bacterium]
MPWTVAEVVMGSAAYERTRALRNEVLLRPFGLADFSREADDAVSRHFAAFDGDAVIGCVVLVPKGQGQGQLRQMAVDPNYQGRGVGRDLVDHLLSSAGDAGLLRISCHARVGAVPFYEKAGFVAEGEPFEEVGMPHLRMHRALGSAHLGSVK